MIVRDAIRTFFEKSTRPILFIGAGASTRVGLPNWIDLVRNLRNIVAEKDGLTAQMMDEKIAERNLTKAAEYFFLSDKILDGDKYRALSSQFGDRDSAPLATLASLPFQGFVTTNFDRCFLRAFRSGELPLDYRNGDPSFKEVLWCKDKYLARVHGFVEAPRTIILSDSQFERLRSDQPYRDFLTQIFSRENVLFLGFSFYDPAIRQVLNRIDEEYGSATPGRHVALISDNAEDEFISKLNKLNVEVVRYDSVSDHKALWDGIETYAQTKTSSPSAFPPAVVRSREPFAVAKRFLAACYARVKLGANIGPLREVVVEGMVAGYLQNSATGGANIDEIADAMHRELGISANSASALVHKAVHSLGQESLCSLSVSPSGGHVVWTGSVTSESTLQESIDELVSGARDRAIVQEGWRTTTDVIAPLQGFFKELVLQRGWDLGAAYASNRVPVDVDFVDVMRRHRGVLSTTDTERLVRICESILKRPTEKEARILADLGRVSFALELAIQSPRSTVLHSAVLPEKIYLDANVLMPALTPGHPYHAVYESTIKQLREAASRASVKLELVAYWGYLNEVVSHRRLANDALEKSGDNYLRDITREVLYHGATNVNVFVGAYASQSVKNPKLKFREFLQKYAPYSSEEELAVWLRVKGISVVKDREILGPAYAKLSFALQRAYSSGLAGGKEPQLIEHDAYQLSGLAKDREAGRRAILVTTDRTLRGIVEESDLPDLAHSMVSHVGLVQLIDLLLGSKETNANLSGLLWVAKASKRTESLRAYLIALGLLEYDQAMAMEMPGVVEKLADQMNAALESAGVSPDSSDPKRRTEAYRIMGTYEDEFFKSMKASIERLERQRRSD